MERFLVENCGLIEKGRVFAEELVLTADCPTVEKFRLHFVRGNLTKAFDRMKVTSNDQEKISQGLFTMSSAPAAAKRNQIVPINDERVVLTDCFLTHDWGMDERERSNHARVAKVNTYLKEKG